MTNETKKIGDLGEDAAVKFLQNNGYKILDRNFQNNLGRRLGEIDIIARKGQKLHFVEVKSVSHLPVSYETDGYNPEDNLHPRKLMRLKRIIQTYLLSYDRRKDVSDETDWQFDVAVVYLDLKGMQAKVNYLEDIII